MGIEEYFVLHKETQRILTSNFIAIKTLYRHDKSQNDPQDDYFTSREDQETV
jgi:hypothetical protein